MTSLTIGLSGQLTAMGISPFRLFLTNNRNRKLTTFSRFRHWSACFVAPFSTAEPLHHSLSKAPSRTNGFSHVGRRSCSTARERRLDYDHAIPVEKTVASSSGEDRTLPIILAEISRDKKIFQTYSDASEAAETTAAVRREPAKVDDTIAFEVLNKIEDVKTFVEKLTERQQGAKADKDGHSTVERKLDDRSEKQFSSERPLHRRNRFHRPSPRDKPYKPEQLSEEISIVVGRDANMIRLDVNMQQVVDVLHDLDRRIERQVPDVDDMRIPKSRSPSAMLLKMWIPQKSQFVFYSISDLTSSYLRLSKSRLTMFVTLSAVGGYFIAPFDFNAIVLAATIVGTTLCSGAANAVNQLMEIPFDSQMARTRDRPLVRAQLSPLHAVTFALASSSAGTAILYYGVNGIVAGLGLGNLLLYTCVYTPMKRFSIVNTWAGAIVGAIPPLMGWAAATGSLGMGSLLFAGILYSWQFPHFNALSWNMRADYSRAGYCMMSVTNPGLCKRVALRHCVFLHAICFLAPVLDVTTWIFACDSFLLNAVFTLYAWKFYRYGDAKSSRNLFRFSLIYLPAILTFLLISKQHDDTSEPKGKVENFHSLSSLLGI